MAPADVVAASLRGLELGEVSARPPSRTPPRSPRRPRRDGRCSAGDPAVAWPRATAR